MRQYCRYCNNLVTGNGIYCCVKNKEIAESTAKAVNHCKEFEFNGMDAFFETRGYKPREKKQQNIQIMSKYGLKKARFRAMSKAVLFSIKPKYCELIASGKKTIEVRKTRPKIDVPFKGYIYCTKPSKKHQTICGCMILNSDELYRHPKQGIKYGDSIEMMCCNDEYSRDNFLNGKVIGEFICDTIITDRTFGHDPMFKALSHMSDAEIASYCTANEMYGFHISDLVIYDKPKDLDEFMAFGKSNCDCKNCDNCLYMGIDGVCDIRDISQPLFRPPQSWGYVEELP